MIPYVDLGAQFRGEEAELLPKIAAALRRGQWVGGDDVEAFESEVGTRLDVPHIVGVGSGTDALILSLRALGIGAGDEVITAPNSFVSSAAAIVAVGARPVFADVSPDQNIDPGRVEAAISPRTKAIMPVHLTGRIAAIGPISQLAQRHGLRVVEDAAQAFGSRLGGRNAGTFGDAGCFSAHPLKNLNAAGDAGFVATSDARLAARLRELRNNGLQDRNTVGSWGTVSRLDTIQAVILRHRLERLDETIDARRERADRYRASLDSELAWWPERGGPERFDTFHTFVVQVDRRDELRAFLAEHDIGSSVHYPTPIHLQPAARGLGYAKGDFPVAEAQARRIVSLPVHPNTTLDDIDRVVETIHRFYRS